MYVHSSETDDFTYVGKFSHAYFEPMHHIAPCNYNVKFNMSPLIDDFLLQLGRYKIHNILNIQMVRLSMFVNTWVNLMMANM